MIRPICPSDRAVFLALSRRFYDSPAVMHDIPEDYHRRTFDYLMTAPADAACWMLYPDAPGTPDNPDTPDHPVGYALTAGTWSREAGGPVVWLEELFVLPEWQGVGLGHRFFADWLAELKARTPVPVRIRLEVETENEGAIRLYRRMGFEPMSYRSWSLEWPR